MLMMENDDEALLLLVFNLRIMSFIYYSTTLPYNNFLTIRYMKKKNDENALKLYQR